MLTKYIVFNIVQSLFVVWLCSVIVEISVPIMMFVIIWRLKYFVVCYTLIGISVAYKCACIITVHTIGSKPKGLCYIDFNYRTVLTLVSLLEISCLAINTVMIYRIKVANREQMVANIIRSKRFADNS